MTRALDIAVIACDDPAAYAAAVSLARDKPAGTITIPVLGDGTRIKKWVAATSPIDRVTIVRAAPATPPPSALIDIVDRAAKPEGVVACIGATGPCLPARAYGLLTRHTVANFPDLETVLATLKSAPKVMLAGDAALFDKRALAHILDWQTENAVPLVGLLIGRDLIQAADIVARLLIQRARHAVERHATNPPEPGTIAAYEVIAAHGNEIHLGYGETSVLCGRRADWRPSADASFDCGRRCALEPRVAARDIAAETALMMSCDGFTPTDGLAPADFALLWSLVDGMAMSVLAPYRHLQANEPLVAMIEAMALSGYALGEMARVLNGRANADLYSDPSFLVLGDPSLRPVARAFPGAQPVDAMVTQRGTWARLTPPEGTRALTCRLPRPAGDGPFAVVPLTPVSSAEGMRFALDTLKSGDVEVTLYRDRPFDPGPADFAVVPAARPDPAIFETGGTLLRRSDLLVHLFGSDAAVDAARSELIGLLDLAAGFPRPLEWVGAQATVAMAEGLLAIRADRLRHAHADCLREALGTRRIWISQTYASLFPSLKRQGPAGEGPCPRCARRAVTWRYADPVRGHDPRHVIICDRCGIVADQPADNPLRIDVVTPPIIHEQGVDVTVAITAPSAQDEGISLVVQFNEWRTLGIGGTDWHAELTVSGGEPHRHRAALTLPDSCADDIMTVQAFVIDQTLRLQVGATKLRVERDGGLERGPRSKAR